VHSVSTGNPCLTHHPCKSLSSALPNPRHDRDSKATQRTRPDHRPGGHQPSSQPWVSVRSQWTLSRHDLKSAPLAGWEINLPWTATVPRYNLKPALWAVLGVNLLMLLHRSSYWVLLVHGALFCIVRHNSSESPHKGLPPLASWRTCPYTL